MRYNILILHDINDFSNARKTHLDHLQCFERYAPGTHNFVYSYLREPVTEILRNTDFHIIILSTTALAFCRYCRPRELFHRFKEAWSFVARSSSVKCAFPQDDYHQTNDIDKLFKEWSIDVIYSVRPEHKSLLYPLSGKVAEVKRVWSGYVDDNSLRIANNLKMPFERRKFDVVQRVTMHPPWGGYFSQIKGRMAERFVECCQERSELAINISALREDVLSGDDWLALLGSGRFALGSEGGVSLWDPDGIFLDRTTRYLEQHPEAPFEEVEKACFPGEDGKYVFSGFTPRLFEYTMMGCSPILTEGQYRGLLQPWEHYIPVRLDLSDVPDALEATRDREAAKRRVEACYAALMENPALYYSGLVQDVMSDVDRLAAGRGFRETLSTQFCEAMERHRAEQSRNPPLVHIAGRLPVGPYKLALYALSKHIPTRMRRHIPESIRKGARDFLFPELATLSERPDRNDD